jgi:hypothetical protein
MTMDAYNVPMRLPRYAAVGVSRSLEDKLAIMVFQPRKKPKESNMRTEPRENVTANFDGRMMMSGRKTKKANNNNKTPTPAKAAKYAYCVVPGAL